MGKTLEAFTTKEAVKIVDVPYRTIDHWARTSVIEPSVASAKGTGSERKYAFLDLIALRVARDLRAGGVPLPSLRLVVAKLREEKGLDQHFFSGHRFIVVGSDVLIVKSCREMVSALRQSGPTVCAFLLDVNRTISELQQKVEEVRAT